MKGADNSVNRYNRVKTYFSKPQNIILLLFGIVLTFSTVAPIIAIVKDTITIHPGTIDAHLAGKASGYTLVNYEDLFTSRLAKTNLWKPLWNTILLAVFTCTISILYGGTFAFLVTRTNLKFKKYLSSIFIFPYIMPQWTLAVVWQNVFNSNAVVGTSNGLLASLAGICMPKWWCLGLFPSCNDPRYTEMEDDVSHHTSDGKTGDPLDDPSRIRKLHGKLPGTALPWTYHTFHEVHFLKLQVHR